MAKQVNITSAAQLKNYDSDYSESGFWKVVAKISPSLARTALELYYVMKESSTPLATKGLIIAALGYLVCPVDLIPDLIPLLGWTDDAGALALAYNQVKQHVTPEIKCHVDQKLGLNGVKKLPKSLIKLCSNAKTVRIDSSCTNSWV